MLCPPALQKQKNGSRSGGQEAVECFSVSAIKSGSSPCAPVSSGKAEPMEMVPDLLPKRKGIGGDSFTLGQSEGGTLSFAKRRGSKSEVSRHFSSRS